MTDKIKILVTGEMTERGLSLLEEYEKFHVQYALNLKGADLFKALIDTHGLIIRTETAITKELLEKAPLLKAICRSGIGTDHIDLEACRENAVVVMNTPEANRWSVVEMTIGLMISLSRLIPQANEALHLGKWQRNAFTGCELKGKTLGLIGLGNIGGRVSHLAHAFSMKVLACDPYLKPAEAQNKGAQLLGLEEVLEQSEFVSCHVPLTPKTQGLANTVFFEKMKKNSFFINTSRGKVCVEEDLLKALNSGHIRGAALDVFNQEPINLGNPLLKLSQVILTPHTAGQTLESQDNMSRDSALQIRNFFESGKATNTCQE